MTTTGSPHRLRSRRVAFAAAGVGAAVIAAASIWGPTETVASFVDDVWAQATDGFTAGYFVGIEGSLDNEEFDNHTDQDDALDFAPSVSLVPGDTFYASFYLQTTPGSPVTTLQMSAAEQQVGASTNDVLWSGFVRHGVVTLPSGEACNEGSFVSADALIVPGTPLGVATSPETFVLAAEAAESTQVCFEFSLDSSVLTADPSLNGETVHPYWIFEGTPDAETEDP